MPRTFVVTFDNDVEMEDLSAVMADVAWGDPGGFRVWALGEHRAETIGRSDGTFGWRVVEEHGEQVVATDGAQGYSERNDAAEALAKLRPDLEPRWVGQAVE